MKRTNEMYKFAIHNLSNRLLLRINNLHLSNNKISVGCMICRKECNPKFNEEELNEKTYELRNHNNNTAMYPICFHCGEEIIKLSIFHVKRLTMIDYIFDNKDLVRVMYKLYYELMHSELVPL